MKLQTINEYQETINEERFDGFEYENKFYNKNEIKSVLNKIAKDFKGKVKNNSVDIMAIGSTEGLGFSIEKVTDMYYQKELDAYDDKYILMWSPWIYNKSHAKKCLEMLPKVLKYDKCEIVFQDDTVIYNCSIDPELINSINSSSNSREFIDNEDVTKVKKVLQTMVKEFDD